MTTERTHILKDILKLSPKERAEIADQILSSLDQPDESLDNLWRKEVEDRVRAYKEGQIKTISLEDVLAKYHK